MSEPAADERARVSMAAAARVALDALADCGEAHDLPGDALRAAADWLVAPGNEPARRKAAALWAELMNGELARPAALTGVSDAQRAGVVAMQRAARFATVTASWVDIMPGETGCALVVREVLGGAAHARVAAGEQSTEAWARVLVEYAGHGGEVQP